MINKILEFTKTDELRVINRDIHSIGDDEILIKILFAGVCGTDIQIIRRMRNDKATILGHEAIGTIIRLGGNIDNFSINQNIIFNPVNVNNQHEILGHSYEGIFQKYYVANASMISNGLLVPALTGLPNICGPLVEPLGTLIYGRDLVNIIKKPKRIAIVGAGRVGILLSTLLKQDENIDILLIHNNNERAEWIVNNRILPRKQLVEDSYELPLKLLRLTNQKGIDAVYLCTNRTGAKDSLNKALKYIAEFGVINMVGGIQDGDVVSELPDVELNKIRRANICGYPIRGKLFKYQTVSKKIVYLTGHRGTSKKHLYESMQILTDKPEIYLKTYTQQLSLDAAKTLFEKLINNYSHSINGEEFIKAIINPWIDSKNIIPFNGISVRNNMD